MSHQLAFLPHITRSDPELLMTFFLRLLSRITKRALPNSLGEGKTRAIFITDQNAISQSQMFPFYFYRRDLVRELGFTFREIPIEDFERGVRIKGTPNLVFFQPWWDIERDRLRSIIRQIRAAFGGPRIVFLDSYAPVDLRLAQFLDNDIHLYVKKHVLRDRQQYGRPTRGDTNLVDYYGRLYGLKYPETAFLIPQGFIEKLIVGPSFATDRALLRFFVRSGPPAGSRDIDLHARLGGAGVDWYGRMRSHASAKAQGIRGIHTVAGGKVSHRVYLRELLRSKICFSPFGYGEVCWRDYEAVMCGALLVKPDMSHVETRPDIFRPYETYVPVRWDFSDLEEKVRRFLVESGERQSIAQNAYATINTYLNQGGFIQLVRDIVSRA